jgi:hypothetical protein
MKQELNRKQIGFCKNDNAFLATDDVAALQAVADRLSPQIIRIATRLLDADPRAEVLKEGGPQNLNGELRNRRHTNFFIILLVQAGAVSLLKVSPLEGKRG